MKITRISKSRLSETDVKNVSFGKVMSDHMLICTYKDGKWGEAEILPYGAMNHTPALMALHYGQAIFEGMKAYKDVNGDVFLFRPDKNFQRFNKSAERMGMPQISEDIFVDGLKALIDVDRDWVPEYNTESDASLYIRPFMYASSEAISASVSQEFTFAILTSVANSYYGKPLKIKIETHFTRAASGGVGAIKCAGNYGASFYPTALANKEGFDQVIWTDNKEHKYFEESGTMNVMVRVNEALYTPPVSDSILSGVTRDSLVNLAKNNGIEVKEEKISIEWIKECYKKGELKEVFGCGTAVVVSRYSHIGYENEVWELPVLEGNDSFALKLKSLLLGIQMNKTEDSFGWRIKVEKA